MKIFPLASASLGLLVATAFVTRVLAAPAAGEVSVIAVDSDARYNILHTRARLRSLRANHVMAGDIEGAPDDEDSEAVVRNHIISWHQCSLCVVKVMLMKQITSSHEDGSPPQAQKGGRRRCGGIWRQRCERRSESSA
jgi:hypothetical protein